MENHAFNEEEEDEEEDVGLVSDFLLRWEGRSGLYFLSPYFDDTNPDDRNAVKVGMSKHRQGHPKHPDKKRQTRYGGLGRRLDQYLLCYPHGFYIYAIIELPKNDVYAAEKYFHEYFTSKNFKLGEQHSHREEWYDLTRTDVFSTIKAFALAFREKILKFEMFDTPQWIDTSGREATRIKQPMRMEEKQNFQTYFSTPEKVPTTIKKRRPVDD